MTQKNILVFGAVSTIAIEVERLLANESTTFYLVARTQDQLDSVAKDLQTRGAKVFTKTSDLAIDSKHQKIIDDAKAKLGSFDLVLLAHGSLPEQDLCETDHSELRKAIEVNYFSAVSLLLKAAKVMETQQSGTIAAISSVAGDRGRQSNFIYGSAKAGLTVFLAGLRNKLIQKNIQVVTILPGFVDTKMTVNLKKGPLFASAQTVAKGIVKAIDKKKDVVYLPFFWQFIMVIIRNIPERVFKRLKL